MDIDRNKIKRGERESHKICLNRVEIFRWLLKNGINKTDINGVKQRF